MSSNGDGKQPPGGPTAEQREFAMQVFNAWTQKSIAEINTLALLMGAQTTKVMLTVVANVFKSICESMKGALPSLPEDFRSDLQLAAQIARRIEAHLSGVPSLILAPANTKIGGKPI